MPIERPLVSFAGGEISPNIELRSDLARHGVGVALMSGFISMLQGGATRTPGTRYIHPVKDESRISRLARFVHSRGQSFMLEFSHLKIGVFYDTGPVLYEGLPYSIDSIYTEAQLPDLRFQQVGDDIRITGGGHRPHILSRYGLTNWTLTEIEFENGPFDDINPNDAHEIQASAETGSTITLTATGGYTFQASLEGTLMRLMEEDLTLVKHWTADKTYAVGDRVRSDAKVYECAVAGDSKADYPTHDDGSEIFDSGIKWDYLHSGWGIVKIITVAGDGLTTTAEVIKRLPKACADLATPLFSEAVWTSGKGWPELITTDDQRMIYVSSDDYPYKFWDGVTGDFDDFEPGGKDAPDKGFASQAASGSADDIRWVQPTGDVILFGTSAYEGFFRPLDVTRVMAADNQKFGASTTEGAARMPIEYVDAMVLFSTADRVRFCEAVYDLATGLINTGDLTLEAEHMLKPGVAGFVYQKYPWRVIWFWLTDGTLVGLTYNRAHKMIAWHRHPIGGGGQVEGLTVVPSADELTDELWLAVRRTVGGTTRRFIEKLAPRFDPDMGDTLADAWHLFCALKYDGEPKTVFTGLDHFNGHMVSIFADGCAVADQLVTGGQITLPAAASKVLIGLSDTSRLRLLPTVMALKDGTTAARRKKPKMIKIAFRHTVGGRAYEPGFEHEYELMAPSDGDRPLGAAPLLRNDIHEAALPHGWSDKPQVELSQSGPWPMTINIAVLIEEIGGA